MAQTDTISFESLMNERVKAVMFTSGGDTLVGYLVHIDSSSITVDFNYDGLETYFKDEIVIIKYYPKRQIKFDAITEEYAERIFLSATAFNLNKGVAEYRNVMLFYNSFHSGITDNITIGGAVIPAVVVNFAFIDAKANIQLDERIHTGIGLAIGLGFGNNFGFESASRIYSGGYAALTFGNKKRFINLQVGPVTRRELGDKYDREWIYSIGAKLSKEKVNFYTEFSRHPAYFMELANITGLTVKIKSFVYDFMLVMPLQDFLPIPAFSLSRRF